MVGSPHREFGYVEKRSCCAAQLNCLCGTGPCRLCCHGFPPVKESTSTRLIYVLFLLVSVVWMSIFMSEDLQKLIASLFPSDFSICDWLGADPRCHAAHIMGYIAVYRIGFAVSLYHITLAFVTYGVKSSKDCRAGLHNGMWLYKFMMFVLLCVISLFIPDHHEYFLRGWMYTAMVGAALFIVIQLLLLVFFVHSLTDKIQKKVSAGASACLWYSVMAPFAGLALLVVSGLGVALLFLNFANHRDCHGNQWLIFCNAGACFVITLVAVLKRDRKPCGLRLLHASLISVYVIYLTWSALSSAPRQFEKYRSSNDYSHRINKHCGPAGINESWGDMVIPYINFVITIITVVYGSIGISEPAKCRSLELPGCPLPQDPTEQHDRDDSGGQIVIRNEKKSLTYSYSLFHLMLALACDLLMMHLTAWYTPSEASLMNFGRSWSAVWIKMASSWFCIVSYLITVLCPSILPASISSQFPQEPSSVQVNGHAFDFYDQTEVFEYSYDRSNDSDGDSDADSTAVPLTPSRRPFEFRMRQETTV